MRDRILDLVFLLGVLFKGLDGLVELVGGTVLFFLTPDQLQDAASAVTAHELAQDPHDFIANLLIHGTASLGRGTLVFGAVYLVIHGLVKVGIVVALLLGSRKVYPWAIAALIAFLAFQAYELIVHPSVGLVLLTLFDAAIIALTWREWRHGRTLHETTRGTIDWVLRRDRARNPAETAVR